VYVARLVNGMEGVFMLSMMIGGVSYDG